MLNAIWTRWKRGVRENAAAALSTVWAGSGQPPATRSTSVRGRDSLLQSLLRWLPGEPEVWHGRERRQPTSPALLLQLRTDCLACLEGLTDVAELRQSIQRSRGLRDFWYLRSSIYTAVARAFSQAEAEHRLVVLDRHFPARASAPGPRRH